MEPAILYLVVLAVGYIAGAVSAAFIFRNSRGPGLAASEEEFAELRARLAEREKLLGEMRQTVEQSRSGEARLQAELKAESERRAVVEAQAQRVPALEASLAERQTEIAQLRAQSQAGQDSGSQHARWMEEIEQRLGNAVRQAAAQAAVEARDSIHIEPAESRRQVEEAVKPLQECLARVDQRLDDYQRERGESIGSLTSQMQQLTRALSPAASPGRWGEVQLRRVVELAGLAEHCDFSPSSTADLLVHLPGKRDILIDANAPQSAYFEASAAPTGEERRAHLDAYVSAVHAHVEALAATAPPQCDFTVAFLPAESYLAAALEQDPGLLEHGARNKVLLATPTSLIALLKAVSFGWQQEQLATNAQEISQLGHVLYERLAGLTAQFDEVRGALQHSVETYNRAAQTLERQVLPGARRFKDLGVTSAPEIEAPLLA